ncbi:hypothetical protein Misp01_55660 [Microtetraspora sp. NBRC 13810]|uniref:sensor histidine kinase n=1 Tax=Microtetraspora sp. NBRC 13810 TaxID=3030990 RepID=UPI0024A29853|nr:HAMP domain-containing sensor histidine kinase [Microtetraspora sp. NBRC 13810]GLW10438.1 hypothetical protein Misp01_55660 [Microtetraspora sp. NBRC 13810]
MSLRNRVTLAGGAVVLGALLLTSLILYLWQGANLRDRHDSELVAAVAQTPELLSAFKQRGLPPAVVVSVGPIWLQLPLEGIEGIKSGFLPVDRRDVRVAAREAAPYFHDAVHDGVGYRVYTAPYPGADGLLVRAAVPVSVIDATLDRLLALLGMITVAGTVLAASGARLAAGGVLRPVSRLTEAVEHVTATQDLSARVEAGGNDEIARLARSFSLMMGAVEESVRTQRQLVADASHELRTPLTSLNTNLELLAEKDGLTDPEAPALVDDARRQAEELKALVNDLIDLGRYGRTETHTEDTRLDLLAEAVVARATRRAPHLEFHVESAPCLVHADPDAVERAVGNLVDNAVKWSPGGGRVLVRVEAGGTVSVTDQGPGIPAADLPHIFDRFYRSPSARSMPGSGLGLAIVRQVAETHGGTVTAEPLNRGVQLRMSLPPTH